MGLTLVLEAYILLYIAYADILSIIIEICICLGHHFYDTCPCCTHLNAHTTVWCEATFVPLLPVLQGDYA